MKRTGQHRKRRRMLQIRRRSLRKKSLSMTKKTKNGHGDQPSRQKATNWKGEASGERMKTPTETKEPQNTVRQHHHEGRTIPVRARMGKGSSGHGAFSSRRVRATRPRGAD